MLKYNQEDAVLFLIFNRVDTTSKVFQAIKEAAPKRLYVAADGPRSEKEVQKCEIVREIATSVSWDCEVKTLFQDENLGCKNAVSSAINWFFEQEEQGIILEDDCLPSSSFFGFCSVLLEKFKDDNRIGHIGGGNFQGGIKRGDSSYYFSRLPHVWGWASWRRVWGNYDVDMRSFSEFSVSDLENSACHAPYKEIWFKNFEDTYKGKIDTWDYQYAYFNLIHNCLSIIPNQNLIKNIGFGAQATHTTGDHVFANLETGEIDSITHPPFFLANLEADLYTLERQLYQPPVKQKNILSRTWRKIKNK